MTVVTMRVLGSSRAPLNIGRSHLILASLNIQKSEALIYDPMHREHNTNRAEIALENFVRDNEKFEELSRWKFVEHPVRTLLSVACLFWGCADV
jgi:hypothetical protein